MNWRKLNLFGVGQEQVQGCCWHGNEPLDPKTMGNFFHIWSIIWAYTGLRRPAKDYTGLQRPAQAYTDLHRPAQAYTGLRAVFI